jgi:cysteinyl-tRNA synthetase
MIELVQALIEEGHAYVGADGVVYYDVQSFPQYGRLSGNTLATLREGAGGRISTREPGRQETPRRLHALEA